jgi:hypothetical protein
MNWSDAFRAPDGGEELLLLERYGSGFLRFVRHVFAPPDGPPRPWFEVSAQRDALAPVRSVGVKARELRALGRALLVAADALEAEGYDFTQRARRREGPGGGTPRAPAQHRTVPATAYLEGQRKRRGPSGG